MKHEALTDAISMLDDDLVAEALEPFRKRRYAPVIRLCAAAAACAAVVCGFLLIPKDSGTNILVMGADPSVSPVAVNTEVSGGDDEVSVVRAFALDCTDIPVSVVSSGKTVVSVSAGELYITDGNEERTPADSPLELNGNASLLWSVPLWDSSARFELTVQTGDSCRVLLLSYDENAQEWTVTERSAE